MLDRILKGTLVLLAVTLIAVTVKGIPVQLVIAGPSSSSGIPLDISGGRSPGGRYQMATATNGLGTVFVTRMDTWTGTVEVFSMNIDGKLVPAEKK
jgi:hypothetical protein